MLLSPLSPSIYAYHISLFSYSLSLVFILSFSLSFPRPPLLQHLPPTFRPLLPSPLSPFFPLFFPPFPSPSLPSLSICHCSLGHSATTYLNSCTFITRSHSLFLSLSPFPPLPPPLGVILLVVEYISTTGYSTCHRGATLKGTHVQCIYLMHYVTIVY